MSDIQFNCSECGKEIGANQKRAGMVIRCPECGERTLVLEPHPTSTPPEREDTTLPTSSEEAKVSQDCYTTFDDVSDWYCGDCNRRFVVSTPPPKACPLCGKKNYLLALNSGAPTEPQHRDVSGDKETPSATVNLFPCPDCGNAVSKLAASCPKCGRVLKVQEVIAKEGCFLQTMNAGCQFVIIIIVGMVIVIWLTLHGCLGEQ